MSPSVNGAQPKEKNAAFVSRFRGRGRWIGLVAAAVAAGLCAWASARISFRLRCKTPTPAKITARRAIIAATTPRTTMSRFLGVYHTFAGLRDLPFPVRRAPVTAFVAKFNGTGAPLYSWRVEGS